MTPAPAATDRIADVAPDVLGRARAGDGRAFSELVRHYDAGLRCLAYRLLGRAAAMDDALQESYLKAFRALPGFRGEATVGTWLYAIVYRTCIDELRREGRHLTEALDPQGAAATGSAPDVAAAARVDLGRALERLPPDQRGAVLLVDAFGFDYGAAAAVLGVAPGTVASRLSRARAVLRAALAEGGDR